MLSCTNDSNNDKNATYKVAVHVETDPSIRFSSVFTHVKYTLLCDKDSFLIGNVDKMKICDEKIILLSSGSVLVFDRNTGKDLLCLRRSGNASHEYASLDDVLIDDSTHTMELLDSQKRKIRRYDFNGNFLSEITLPFRPQSFFKKDADDYWFYNSHFISDVSKSKLVHYNVKKEKVEHEYFRIDDHLASYFYVIEGNNFNRYSSKLTFVCTPEHVLYDIREQGDPAPTYAIDFGKNQVPPSFFERRYEDIADFVEKADKAEYIFFVTHLAENEHYIFFSYKFVDAVYWSFYNKAQHTTNSGRVIYDDIRFGDIETALHYSNCFASTDDSFYFLLQPYQFIELVENYKSKNGDARLEELMRLYPDMYAIYSHPDFNDQSNPILVTCKIK
jgi:hypothetical protein